MVGGTAVSSAIIGRGVANLIIKYPVQLIRLWEAFTVDRTSIEPYYMEPSVRQPTTISRPVD